MKYRNAIYTAGYKFSKIHNNGRESGKCCFHLNLDLEL